jgi:hypothetical protein
MHQKSVAHQQALLNTLLLRFDVDLKCVRRREDRLLIPTPLGFLTSRPAASVDELKKVGWNFKRT